MVRRVMVIAGEPSGDLHGAGLVRELRKRHPSLEVFGIGGDGMAREGMELLYHIRELSFMGFAEVLKHLPTMRRVEKGLEQAMILRRPDLLVLIDYPGFNLRLARKVKSFGARIFYYISPQVWAWGRRRVDRMKGLIEKMFVVFPFEVEIYQKAGIPVQFVGHPLLEVLANEPMHSRFREQFGIPRGKKLIGLFPGSRIQEIERILPVLAEVGGVLQKELDCEIAVGVAPNLKEDLYARLVPKSARIHLVNKGTYGLMQESDLAFVTSGTATLETACFGTPMIVVYRTSMVTYLIARMLVTLRNIALVNIVAGRRVVPEFVQGRMTVGSLVQEARRILEDETLANEMRTELKKVREKLGTPGASARVAEQILSIQF